MNISHVENMMSRPMPGRGIWGGIQDWASGLRERMMGQPISGLSGMQFGMPNISLIDAFKKAKGLFTNQAPMQKYLRDDMSPKSVAPTILGAGAPTALGDVRSALKAPYSPPSPSRMQRIY